MRTPSPRRRGHQHIDIGFSDTVSNVVEIVKEEHRKNHKHYGHHGRFPRGIFFNFYISSKQLFSILSVYLCI